MPRNLINRGFHGRIVMVRSVGDQCVPEGVEASDLCKGRVVPQPSFNDQGSKPLPRPLSCTAHFRLEGREQATKPGSLRALKVLKEAKLSWFRSLCRYLASGALAELFAPWQPLPPLQQLLATLTSSSTRPRR